MTDLRALESELLAAVTAAKDETALEAVRVAALGRNGSVSALLKTLGTMTPEARKEQGPLINSLKDRLSAAIAARKDALRGLALEQRLNTETVWPCAWKWRASIVPTCPPPPGMRIFMTPDTSAIRRIRRSVESQHFSRATSAACTGEARQSRRVARRSAMARQSERRLSFRSNPAREIERSGRVP